MAKQAGKLTEKHILYIDRYMANGYDRTEAYKAAYAVDSEAKEESIKRLAYKIHGLPQVEAEIKRRITELSAIDAEQTIKERIKARAKWSRDDSINALKKIVSTCIDGMAVHDDDGSIIKTDAAAANSARGAIDSINKMLGYNEPEKSDVTNTITIDLGGADDWAI